MTADCTARLLGQLPVRQPLAPGRVAAHLHVCISCQTQWIKEEYISSSIYTYVSPAKHNGLKESISRRHAECWRNRHCYKGVIISTCEMKNETCGRARRWEAGDAQSTDSALSARNGRNIRTYHNTNGDRVRKLLPCNHIQGDDTPQSPLRKNKKRDAAQ